MPGVPFSFDQAFWSDPLALVPGALPASPPSAGKGNTTLLQAASMSGIAGHASLVAGQWPTAPVSGPGSRSRPRLPAAAAALLHVRPGDVLRLRDSITNAAVSFDITGLFMPRQSADPADSYWKLSYIPVSGRSASSGSITYGPLVVSQAAFGPGSRCLSGSWVAQPDVAAFADGDLNQAAGSVDALARALPNSSATSTALSWSRACRRRSRRRQATSPSRGRCWSSARWNFSSSRSWRCWRWPGCWRPPREAETALLAARGATRLQLTRLTAAEVIPLSALVSVVGALAGIWLASALVTAGPLGGAGIRLADQAGKLAQRAGGGHRRGRRGGRPAARSRADRQSGRRRGPGAAGRPV